MNREFAIPISRRAGFPVRLLGFGSLVLALLAATGLETARADAWPIAAPAPGSASAQEERLYVLQDPLTQAGIAQPGYSRTGRNSRHVSDEGLLLRVTGRYVDSSQDAAIGTEVLGLTLPDGELRLRARVVHGAERATLLLLVRTQPDRQSEYEASFEPHGRRVRIAVRHGAEATTLAEATLTEDLVSQDGWNEFAVRVQGPHLLMLVNGQPVLSAWDESYERGRVWFALQRSGDLDDEEESAVVVRDLAVAAIDGAEPARAPTYHPPPPVGPLAIDDPLSQRGTLWGRRCATQKNAVDFVSDGYRVTLNGKCTPEAQDVGLGEVIRGLAFRDGEVRVELRPIANVGALRVRIYLRAESDLSGGYVAEYLPGRAEALIVKRDPGAPKFLARRTDLRGLAGPSEWTSLAVRLHRSQIWMLIDDRPVLWAVDDAYDGGKAFFWFVKPDRIEDPSDTVVVMRNLRVADLADAPPDRAITYGPPTIPPP